MNTGLPVPVRAGPSRSVLMHSAWVVQANANGIHAEIAL